MSGPSSEHIPEVCATPADGRGVVSRVACLPFVAGILLYKVTLSPLMGGHCRYIPTCSTYGLTAFRTLPTHRAAWVTLRRVLACHPFSRRGAWDPVPLPGEHAEAGGDDRDSFRGGVGRDR